MRDEILIHPSPLILHPFSTSHTLSFQKSLPGVSAKEMADSESVED
jgi:hypothetical protein